VVKLLVEMLEPYQGRVYDPCCGSSGMFVQSVEFIRAHATGNGNGGKAHLNAYLDDYAFLIDALLEVLQTRWQREDLEFALTLSDVLLEAFHDPDAGGFFFTSADHESLIHRPKPLGDESIPSGNGIAAQVLQRLGHLVGELRYLTAAEGTLALASDQMRRIPYAHASLLAALEEHLNPGELIVIRAEGDALTQWQRAAQEHYAPRRLVLAIPADEKNLPSILGSMPGGALSRAYRCVGTSCEAPIEDLATLAEVLEAG